MNELKSIGKEDYFVLATIQGDGLHEENVPCKIFLPERLVDVPTLLLKPTRAQWERIARTFRLSLTATLGERDTGHFVQIDVPRMYALNSTSRQWGKDLWDPHITCEAWGLTISTALQSDGVGDDIYMTFRLTPNSLLTPMAIVTTSYTGQVDIETLQEIVVPRSQGHFKFETHYRHITEGKDETRSIKSLAATTKTARTNNGETKSVVADVIQELDDLLLVASLGARQQTVCISWEAIDGQFIHRSFRHGNVGSPQGDDKDSHSRLIDVSLFEEYLRAGFERIRGFGKRSPLHLAVYSLVPFRTKTLEDDFVALFGALEKLLLAFRVKQELEVVIGNVAWKALRGAIKQTIKSFDAPAIEESKRAWLYENLTGLNRVPLGSAFSIYMHDLGVGVADLWPAFSNDDGISLYKIRNYLTHREPMDQSVIRELSIARQHLAWTLERICLQTLGWSVAKSNVAPAALLNGRYAAMADWCEARNGLTEVLSRS